MWEASAEPMPYVHLSLQDLHVLLEALALSERVRPSQLAKRNVFRRWGVAGSWKDPILTAIFYDTLKRLGIIDRIIVSTGIDLAGLPPKRRWLVRLAVELLCFERHTSRDSELKRHVMRLLHKMEPSLPLKKLARCSLPKPKNLFEELSIKFSVSEFLVKKLVEQLGPKEAIEFLKTVNDVPPMYIKVNRLLVDDNSILESLRQIGVGVEPSRVESVYRIKGRLNLDNFKPLRRCEAIIEDEASALAPRLLVAERSANRIFDMCAAPGYKTLGLAEAARGCFIVAGEIKRKRVARLKKFLGCAGAWNVEVVHIDSTLPFFNTRFDAVLVDAPCTGTGTIAKNHELRWRIGPDDIMVLQKLQLKLLETGLKLLRCGGRLLYTVCSVFVEEGEIVIEKILREWRGKVELVELREPYTNSRFLHGTMRAWPHKHGTIGFFYALLEKRC